MYLCLKTRKNMILTKYVRLFLNYSANNASF